ncbi:hypothetical protein BpHYR1_045008 [Brachionus plicatilis]|uniref:Uncharacterized protein n=1 Tax=Brachionus plicatilis TaxID=10195 RepID=A0A3M7PVG3_BRAPC|nr:hypothetical protein BpHYR1_045008 [Brachionus plicatilis]
MREMNEMRGMGEMLISSFLFLSFDHEIITINLKLPFFKGYSLIGVVNNCSVTMFQYINGIYWHKKSVGWFTVSRLELVSKLVYFMNQNMCLKYPNLKIDWLFKDSRPLLPVDSAFRDVHSTLNSILEPNLVNSNPVYEFNFTANFEIAIDEKNNFVDPTSNLFKYRIPILIVNNSYYYSGVEEFKKPVANYVDNFKKLYPLVTVNSSKLEEMKTMKDKLDYIRGQIINVLNKYSY